ncbi:hypothetical protein ANHYDRO_00798 [Anaerococcus hydrogenalis DSM 7454]|uniref:Uncharacterized protein n=1 Tax=Anaerococcus hydrogenalis DSM 7454 TaxID=561177 RepID=B6W899_9FIRM|nr:hypothetical protein ANHYDRO_00798 [Anaerococcus hydrogenalis DSM 7454]
MLFEISDFHSQEACHQSQNSAIPYKCCRFKFGPCSLEYLYYIS